MSTNPLIELIKQNFSDLDSLRQLQTAIECMIEEREYEIASKIERMIEDHEYQIANGGSSEWPPVSSVRQVNNK